MQETPNAKLFIEILSNLQGPYYWGERDCVVTSSLLINMLTIGVFPISQLQEWHGHTYEKAILHAEQRHGSLEAAYIEGLVRTQGVVHITEPPGAVYDYPGSILLCSAPIMAQGYTVSKKYPVLCFVDPSNVPWVWATTGLVPMREYNNISSLFALKYREK